MSGLPSWQLLDTVLKDVHAAARANNQEEQDDGIADEIPVWDYCTIIIELLLTTIGERRASLD